MSKYTEQAGFAIGRDWNTGQMALMRCRNAAIRDVNIFEFLDHSLTVAALSAEDAVAHLTGEWALADEDVQTPELVTDLDAMLFEDRDGCIRFPDFNDGDGENRVYPFREALDIMLVELGFEAPFIFTEEF